MAREVDPARCRRHPRHRHSAGVCPFCLRDRLLAARAEANAAPSSSSSSGSGGSPCTSSWEEIVAPPAHPPPRRERLGMLLLQEGREAAVLGAAAAPEVEERETETAAEADKKAKRGNFWARLQQQLHHGGWHRKDGCSLAHSGSPAEKSAAAARPRRAPVV